MRFMFEKVSLHPTPDPTPTPTSTPSPDPSPTPNPYQWPRLVAEYKPAFGSIFARYLKKYTHWGYCDLDMVRGNSTLNPNPNPNPNLQPQP